MTQREFDCLVERLSAGRLDRWLTSKGIQFERAHDKERQVKGIDIIIFGKSGRSIKVDEKAKWQGLQEEGAQLRSYSFEVSRICADGQRRLGWFIDPHIETDYLCYEFPKLDGNNLKPNMQVDLFSKSDILQIVQQEAALDKIYQTADEMDILDTRLVKFKNFALYKTPAHKLPEEPINIVMSRELVENTLHFRRFYI